MQLWVIWAADVEQYDVIQTRNTHNQDNLLDKIHELVNFQINKTGQMGYPIL